jgi:hypothetical protein
MKDAMFVILLIALSNFLVGSIMGPSSESEAARGFTGYSSMSINQNSMMPYSTKLKTLLNLQLIC